MKTCAMCGDRIDKQREQFGDIGQEVCIICWLKHDTDGQAPESWYGLGPHVHIYDKDGQIMVGGTTFLSLDNYPKDESGVYLIDGQYFMPDPEAPGLGMWSRR